MMTPIKTIFSNEHGVYLVFQLKDGSLFHIASKMANLQQLTVEANKRIKEYESKIN